MKQLAILVSFLALIAIFAACAKANDPAAPAGVLSIVAQRQFAGDPQDFVVTQDYVYVAEDQAGFSIWQRDGLQLISQNWDYDVDIRNAKYISVVEEYDRVYVYNTTGTDGIFIIDVSDPAATVWVGQDVGSTQNLGGIRYKVNTHEYPEQYFDEVSQIVGMRTIDNQFLYGYIEITDTADIPNGSPDDLRVTLPNDLRGFDEDFQYFYLTGEQLGLYIVDKTTHALGQCDTPGEALQVAVNGDIAYIADRQDGLAVIDISDRANPVLLDTGYNTSGYAQSLDFEGDWLAVGSGGGGVYLFDISDPAAPKFVDRIPTSEVGYTRCVDIQGGRVYVASRDNGLVELTINP
ncbi:MAG: hypothetical protein K8R90_10250 [Candidatus Cloacimonetes bacterium]|nr:hypothetical protein [Candidatus Cloacimonadota bacterium]